MEFMLLMTLILGINEKKRFKWVRNAGMARCDTVGAEKGSGRTLERPKKSNSTNSDLLSPGPVKSLKFLFFEVQGTS